MVGNPEVIDRGRRISPPVYATLTAYFPRGFPQSYKIRTLREPN